jgi:hypothetical protein
MHRGHPDYKEGVNGDLGAGQPWQKKTWEPTWKITKAKKGWGMAQVVEPLPSKYEALSSNTAPKTQRTLL